MNVNNPHFLIMQGRVTKVLNMKPREILLMIEEAAGVRVYEAKRRNAMSTIEKKENKIDNMNKAGICSCFIYFWTYLDFTNF
jgi:structural maintenance of chromosome 2